MSSNAYMAWEEPLYDQVVVHFFDQKLGVPCRIYAPVAPW